MKNTLAKSNSTKFWMVTIAMLVVAVPLIAANFSGAIYTTKGDGTSVNLNIYNSKDDVYLNGGPQNQNSNGLPDGHYYYQVTDPSGATLLSSDDIDCRRVQVLNGVISGSEPSLTITPDCSHPNGAVNIANGALPVKLAPFADTPNGGGVYKVWMTPVGKYVGSAGHSNFGFVDADSKTDNFRIECTENCTPKPVDWPLQGFKFYDANANGVFDSGDTTIPNWPMRGIGNSIMIDPQELTQNFPVSNPAYYSHVLTTDANGVFNFGHLTVGGTYGVCEARATAPGFTWIATTQRPIHSNGGTSYETQVFCPRHIQPQPYDNTWTGPIDETANGILNANACLVAGIAPNSDDIQVGDVYVNLNPGRGPVEFGNVCTGAGGGLTLGFWSNKNGQSLETTGDFTLLTSLNLKNANGSDRDFTASLATNKSALNSWLLSATATNMAYMLSAQLTAMELNVAHAKVSGTALVYAGAAPAGCTVAGLSGTGFITISDLMTDANASLGLHPITVASGTDRSCQEFMKTTLDRGNNNLNFVQGNGSSCIAASTFSDCSATDVTNVETGVDTGIGFIPPQL
jgi:hypothetical protein